MMISTKANLAFLAMPRAASTSIEESLLPHADIAFKGYPRFKHMNLAMYNLRLRPFLNANSFEGLETVALFRDPVSWLASWFKYRSDASIKLKRNSTAGIDFNEFVEAYLMENTPDFANVGQQSNFVANKKSICGIDHLFKFENLDKFSDFISQRFDIEFNITRRNESVSRNTDLSKELRKELVSFFDLDYQIYESIAK